MSVRGLAWLLAVALAAGPVHAAPAEDPDAEARQLHERGQTLFDTADYPGAIDAWTRAYAALPDRPESAAMRPLILYNIATAREKAYDVYGDVAQLKQARVLLRGFAGSIDAIYDDADERAREHERVDKRIAELEARIAQHEEAAAPEPSEPSEPAPSEPEPGPATTPSSEPTPPSIADAPRKSGPDGRLVAGAVLAGTGGVAAAIAFAGIGMGVRANDIDGLDEDDLDGRERQFDRGRIGNSMAIAGAVAAPLLIAAGVTLIILSKTRPRGGSGTKTRARVGAGGLAVHF